MPRINPKQAKKNQQTVESLDKLRGNPLFKKIDHMFKCGVVLENRTVDDLYQAGKTMCKQLGLAGWGKAEAHRMHDAYRKMKESCALDGKFYEAYLKLGIAEEDLRIRLTDLLGGYVPETPQDIRDHANRINGVEKGNGAPWRDKCVEVLREMQELAPEMSAALEQLEDAMQGVFADAFNREAQPTDATDGEANGE